MRAVNAGGEVDVLGIKEVSVIDLGVADDIVEDEEFEKIFARVREEEEEDDEDEDGYEMAMRMLERMCLMKIPMLSRRLTTRMLTMTQILGTTTPSSCLRSSGMRHPAFTPLWRMTNPIMSF
jgi:hypothetical protein